MELRRGAGQNYHYRCREGAELRKVEYNSGGVAWVPCQYCVGRVGVHNANGPTVPRGGYDEHGGRVGDYPTVEV